MSVPNLDKSLEDIIKEKRQNKVGTDGGGQQRMINRRRPQRQGFNRTANRSYNGPRIRRRGDRRPRRPARNVSAVQCWR